MANDIEVQLREMKKDIKEDIHKVSEDVKDIKGVFLEKIDKSMERLMQLQIQNADHNRKLEKHGFWLVIHSMIL